MGCNTSHNIKFFQILDEWIMLCMLHCSSVFLSQALLINYFSPFGLAEPDHVVDIYPGHLL